MLRTVMQREHLAAFIFPSTDPHNGEYIPEHWEGRKWISGFTGSAGTAVVTMTSAALWTDSRYFIAAEQELRGTEFRLMKQGLPGTPTIAEWLSAEVLGEACQRATHGSTEVGIDGSVYATAATESLIADLRRHGGMTLRTNLDPLQAIWADRPSLPLSPVEIQPLEYCGVACADKLKRIRHEVLLRHASGLLVSSLDDIAWTLNLRGTDVHCNPVFVAYLLITQEKATLFVDGRKLSSEVRSYLAAQGVQTDEYANVGKALTTYSDYSILLDDDELNYTLFCKVRKEAVVRGTSPIPALKAIKTEAEVAGFRQSMVSDGVALVRFQRWLMENVGKGTVTELSASDKLTSLRAEMPLYRDNSFDTIAAYQEHGAIVHYEPTAETDVALRPEGFILIDSGAQYQNATTDITRTIPLGPLTHEQRLVYTLVLKGHIDLQMLKFPEGASGTQLDAIARQHLWSHGYNFLHGTGHGVGSYLNVHEGPHQIRMEYRPAPLHAGMTVTDEPGIYVQGEFGVRIENTLVIQPYRETQFGAFLQFETLTLCPIDTAPILVDMMSPEELQWLNDYHKRVFDTLSPLLDEADSAWLAQACKPLER